MDVITQTVLRLQKASAEKLAKSNAIAGQRVLLELEDNTDMSINNTIEILKTNGVIKLSNILSAELCNQCLEMINNSLQDAINTGIKEYYTIQDFTQLPIYNII